MEDNKENKEEEKKEIVESENTDSISKELFFGLIVSAGMIGHIKHLQCKGVGSFAAHLAMKEFYEGAPEIADSIIETYQGYAKEILQYDCEAIPVLMEEEMTPMEYLEGLKEAIEMYRYDIVPKSVSNIHNEIDNFVTLIEGVIYKLTFLQ